LFLGVDIVASLTLKNIPDDLYEKLRERAAAHRRSINGEMIHCLEQALLPRRLAPEDRLQRIRALRPAIDPQAVTHEDLIAAVNDGRP
jgi:plasmid stability protein